MPRTVVLQVKKIHANAHHNLLGCRPKSWFILVKHNGHAHPIRIGSQYESLHFYTLIGRRVTRGGGGGADKIIYKTRHVCRVWHYCCIWWIGSMHRPMDSESDDDFSDEFLDIFDQEDWITSILQILHLMFFNFIEVYFWYLCIRSRYLYWWRLYLRERSLPLTHSLSLSHWQRGDDMSVNWNPTRMSFFVIFV